MTRFFWFYGSIIKLNDWPLQPFRGPFNYSKNIFLPFIFASCTSSMYFNLSGDLSTFQGSFGFTTILLKIHNPA